MKKVLVFFSLFMLFFAINVYAEDDTSENNDTSEEVVETENNESEDANSEDSDKEETTNNEEDSQEEKENVFRISPAVIEVQTPVIQGSSDFLTDFLITNNTSKTQTIEFKQKDYLKPDVTSMELEPNEEKELPVHFQVPTDLEEGKRTDIIEVIVTSESGEPQHYEISATYNVVKEDKSIINFDLKYIVGGVIGLVLLIAIILLLSRRSKTNKITKLYTPKK